MLVFFNIVGLMCFCLVVPMTTLICRMVKLTVKIMLTLPFLFYVYYYLQTDLNQSLLLFLKVITTSQRLGISMNYLYEIVNLFLIFPTYFDFKHLPLFQHIGEVHLNFENDVCALTSFSSLFKTVAVF